VLSSVQNPTVRALAALKKHEARIQTRTFMVEGHHMVHEALRLASVRTLIVSEDRQKQCNDHLAIARKHNIPILMVSEHIAAKISDTKTPQGILAQVEMPDTPALINERMILMDDVQDPGNVGAILRTAVAMEISDVMLTNACADVYSPKTLRATMGAVFRARIARTDFPLAWVEQKRKVKYKILSSEVAGEAVQAIQPPWVLMIGNEAHGVSSALRNLATRTVTIPMCGGTESLNAAVAAGILLYALTNKLE